MDVQIKKFDGMLPPAPDKCQECAGDHEPTEPHHKPSLYYQMKFYQEHNRWPTWEDAMAHCAPGMQAAWIDALCGMGIKVD